jgi:hypothetical protein
MLRAFLIMALVAVMQITAINWDYSSHEFEQYIDFFMETK